MVVFISGSVNSGKSTTSKLIAEKLGAERVDVDEIVSIPNFDLSKDIPEAIQQSIKHINNLTDNGKNVIANYVLRQQDYEQLSSGLTDPNQHYFTLAPNLQIALSNRGRGMNSWEYERIKYHYDTGIANPKFGTIIDTSNMSIEMVANKIILYINKQPNSA